ncbi:YqcC family protein [Alteromonas sp. A081]|uniref:YqcC family protein n=1 Tax=Alteromonas sp. A081 TaxID=3410269 RepID=UPI003B97E524
MINQIYRDMASAIEILVLLMDNEELWPNTMPSEAALCSQVPFAVDTMAFESWLAYVFIPKMKYILSAEMPIPKMSIAPAAEHYFTSAPKVVIEQLSVIDALSSKANSNQ